MIATLSLANSKWCITSPSGTISGSSGARWCHSAAPDFRLALTATKTYTAGTFGRANAAKIGKWSPLAVRFGFALAESNKQSAPVSMLLSADVSGEISGIPNSLGSQFPSSRVSTRLGAALVSSSRYGELRAEILVAFRFALKWKSDPLSHVLPQSRISPILASSRRMRVRRICVTTSTSKSPARTYVHSL